MITLTLALMRRSLSRLVPAGLAIALGTAFVAATLLTGNVMTRSTYDGMTAQYAAADLVVRADGSAAQPLDDSTLATVLDTPGVSSAAGLRIAEVQLSHGSRQLTQPVIPVTSDPALNPLVVTSGAAPTTNGQIALPQAMGRRLGVGVGDTVTATWWPAADSTDPASGSPTQTTAEATAGAAAEPTSPPDRTITAELTVTGLVADPTGAYSQWGGMGLSTPDAATQWSGGQQASLDAVLLTTTDVEATRAALTEALPAGTLVRTKDQAAEQRVSELSDGSNQLVTVVLGFAAIALLVAALVISNTFQVLVAQRTRTLALLRCVGARRSQLRTAVLTEGALLGLGSSAVGVLAGLGLAQLALVVLGRMHLDVPLPAVVPMSVSVVLVPLAVGTLVTVAATLVPARAATRVPPIAALRPEDAPTTSSGAGRFRLTSSLVLVIGGLGLLAAATAMAALGGGDRTRPENTALMLLGVGVLGGAASFIGVLVGAVLWMPRVVAALGRLLGGLGPASRLAAANTQRNPRRTAATSTALLIGVTLVVTMRAGAASARSSLTSLLDEHFPVDLVVEAGPTDGGRAELPADTLGAGRGTNGVAHAATIEGTTAQVGSSDVTVYGLSEADARSLLHDPALTRALAAGSVLVSTRIMPQQGTTLQLSSASHPTPVAVTAVPAPLAAGSVVATPALLRQLTASPEARSVWAALAPDADAATVLSDVQDSLSRSSVSISSAAARRAGYERVIDTLLGIVVALLGVAVLIALIGVTNTLSLSVLERRRESATLRAIGLTRRQLRGTLAMEGMVIAGVGAALGIVLGLLYGWAGATIIFGTTAKANLAVPWSDLGLVVVVAVLAGLLASVLPSRAAVRTPPVASLATE